MGSMASEFQRSCLPLAEFTTHGTEFWAGDDPAAAGFWVFGLFPATAG
jgi:hypothetical protein